MVRRCLKAGALALAIVAGLLLGQWTACIALPAWLGNGHAGGSGPTAVVPCTQQDLGTVPQGEVLQTGFPVTNTGTRRLILLEKSRACCGQSTPQHQTAVLPGEATELRVEVDTSQWSGRMREVVHYATNDPDLPRFSLTLNAQVESPASSVPRQDGGHPVPHLPGTHP